jgi:hypothetical protein
MNQPEELYRREADFLLREHMNKLKGFVDLLNLGVLDTMSETEKQEFLQKMQQYMDRLYAKLDASISAQ